MIALFDICDPHSQGCTAQTDICNVWYFPNTNEFHFFTISDEDTVILRSAIYLAAADLEFAVPHAKATIEQVDLKARQAPGFRHGKG